MRSLAVAGFIAIICLIAWLSVQIVTVAPSAFSSLASLAEGISSYEDTISEEMEDAPAINTTKTNDEINSGDSVTIDWDDDENTGIYSFAFTCIDGVTVTAMRTDGGRAIECDTKYLLGEDTSITLSAESNLPDTVTIPYDIYFKRVGDTDTYRTGNGSFMVASVVKEEATGEVAGESTSEEEVVVENTTPTTPTVVPEPVIEYQYAIPASNPNGFVDLAAKFVNVGGDVDGRFVAGSLQKESTGAFQFEVKNIGTKTSSNWKFTVTLPDGGNYTSETQRPLKPNERTTLALSINTDDDSSHTFIVVVEETNDTRLSNNSFSQRVTLIK